MQADEVNFDPNIKDCLKLNFDRYRIKKYHVFIINKRWIEHVKKINEMRYYRHQDNFQKKYNAIVEDLKKIPKYTTMTTVFKKNDATKTEALMNITKRSYAASCLIGNKV